MEENLKYVVLEMQTDSEGVVATLTDTFDRIDSAYNKYYTILAYAAVSTLPRHAACLISNDGVIYDSRHFDHVISEE